MTLPLHQRVFRYLSVFLASALLSGLATIHAAPVAYWSFDSDFTATIGGPAFDATPFGGATIDSTQSRFGGASARFDRALSQYLRIDNSPFTQGSHTFAAWYYLDLPSITSGRYFVLEASDGGNWPVSYGLRLLDGVESGQVFSHSGSTPTPNVDFPSGSQSQWHHIAVTYDASTLEFEIYLNGDALDIPFALEEGATTIAPSTFLIIGGHRAGTGRNWHGWIDDLAVWDRVLDPSEIAHLQTNPVPEPAAYGALLGIAAIGLALWRRRQARS